MTEPRHTIRTWALIATAVTSAAVIYFAWWLIDLLAAPNWCQRAMGAAEEANARPEFAVRGCFNLLRLQVEALAINSHVLMGTLALCLAVLVVIVLAGGRVSFKASRTGVEGEMGKDRPVVRAAKRVEEASSEAASEEVAAIEQEADAPPADKRAMPEPEIDV